MRSMIYLAWIVLSVPIALLLWRNVEAVYVAHGALVAIGLALLDLSAAAAAAWLMFDLFIKRRPTADDKAPAANDNIQP